VNIEYGEVALFQEARSAIGHRTSTYDHTRRAVLNATRSIPSDKKLSDRYKVTKRFIEAARRFSF
jgi:hypothetical protein